MGVGREVEGGIGCVRRGRSEVNRRNRCFIEKGDRVESGETEEEGSSKVRIFGHISYRWFEGVLVERDTRRRGQAIPNAHVMVRLNARGVDVLPGADLGEERDGRKGERARAVGVICCREGPCSGGGEVLRLHESKFEVGRQAGGP